MTFAVATPDAAETEGGLSPDGKILGSKGVMALRMADGRPVGQPALLFARRSEFRDWDVSPDGQRFLVVEGAEASNFPAHIEVVVNWFEELKAKVPRR